ncbi:hypothetical protein FG2_2640 [Lactococcus cremoris]|nr:hypothetical protein V4_2193 [Lactococcus cremoris]KZK13701.1 hypothetical protein AB995_0417 [Lactococcus cremoris]KZK42588.1 hypothetical protein FG2_2640 [Lactococcus cremoris]KZK42804.1 hypothetical protein LMG6897_0462 [Lactococcus cremoris]KZK48487.1 hypothetical protein B40_0051 [Lactococcus cremoris]
MRTNWLIVGILLSAFYIFPHFCEAMRNTKAFLSFYWMI